MYQVKSPLKTERFKKHLLLNQLLTHINYVHCMKHRQLLILSFLR